MFLVRSTIANLCLIMIHFNALDFSECRSEEVMFLSIFMGHTVWQQNGEHVSTYLEEKICRWSFCSSLSRFLNFDLCFWLWSSRTGTCAAWKIFLHVWTQEGQRRRPDLPREITQDIQDYASHDHKKNIYTGPKSDLLPNLMESLPGIQRNTLKVAIFTIGLDTPTREWSMNGQFTPISEYLQMDNLFI